ncbi:hypothetical protein B1J92_M05819g [Nakaseomyces glabratus]|nr:hypothetical protein B1J91_M05819g [Nakaseomyces glabratus]OXB45751.1 hypothetical protein B1J92_M05819g [Nakaseomyces glabratus]
MLLWSILYASLSANIPIASDLEMYWAMKCRRLVRTILWINGSELDTEAIFLDLA